MPKAAAPSEAKVSAAKSSEPIQYTYVVTEKESGPYQDTVSEILGTYDSLSQANKSAKTLARSRHPVHWDFDEGALEHPEETQDGNGCVSIEAEDQEGGAWEMTVTRHVKTAAQGSGGATGKKRGRPPGSTSATAKKRDHTGTPITPAKRGRPLGSTSKAKAAATSASASSTAITHVYLVWRIENRRGAPAKIDISRTYMSGDEANAYAKSMARKDFEDWFSKDEGESELVFEDYLLESRELSKNSDGCIFIAARDMGGDSFEIKVEKQMIYT